jgi:phosphate transport system protein
MNRHISEEYDAELDQVRELLMAMGGMVEQQLQKACQAFVTHDAELAETVAAGDKKINNLEVELDEFCINIIARRQPAATDLRTLISIMNACTDLERIGDEAGRIAKMTLEVAHLEYPADQYSDFRTMSNSVFAILSKALDAFARLDQESAAAVIRADESIDSTYRAIVRNRSTAMRENPAEIEQSLNVLWSARALERIGDHSKNIGEYVIYLVRGEDIRHSSRARLSGSD